MGGADAGAEGSGDRLAGDDRLRARHLGQGHVPLGAGAVHLDVGDSVVRTRLLVALQQGLAHARPVLERTGIAEREHALVRSFVPRVELPLRQLLHLDAVLLGELLELEQALLLRAELEHDAAHAARIVLDQVLDGVKAAGDGGRIDATGQARS